MCPKTTVYRGSFKNNHRATLGLELFDFPESSLCLQGDLQNSMTGASWCVQYLRESFTVARAHHEHTRALVYLDLICYARHHVLQRFHSVRMSQPQHCETCDMRC